MLVVAFLKRVSESVRAYLTVCVRATFDVLRGAVVEQASFLKFYSIQLFLTAFAVYVFYSACDQFGSFKDDPSCYAPALNPMQLLALAEIGLFILYVLAFAEANLLLWVAPRVYTTTTKAAGASGSGRLALTSAIYQPAVKWFPFVVIASCLVEWLPLHQIAQMCPQTGSPLPALRWMGVLLPGFALAFFSAVGVELMFRRRAVRRVWLPVTLTFAAYVAVVAFIGPPDLMGIVLGIRALPGLLSGIVHKVIS